MTAAEAMRAWSHPLRVSIVRNMRLAELVDVDTGEDREFEEVKASPIDLAEMLDERLGNVSYHVRILRDLKVLRAKGRPVQRRGALQHFYVLTDDGRQLVDSMPGWLEASVR